jgi:hypothetical protein
MALNRKAIIFTIDAIIAMSVFLASTYILYSYFSEDPDTALTGSGIYTKTENLVRMVDKSELFSSAVNLYQKNDLVGAYAVMGLVHNVSEFATDYSVYLWNGTSLNRILYSEDHDFSQKIVVRKMLVMTITQGGPKTGSAVTTEADSSLLGTSITVPVTVRNTGGAPLTGLTARIDVYNVDDIVQNWTIVPPSQSVPDVAPGGLQILNFQVNIPNNAYIDEYYVLANVTGPGFSQTGRDPFNVFAFGLVEMVVGSE